MYDHTACTYEVIEPEQKHNNSAVKVNIDNEQIMCECHETSVYDHTVRMAIA